MSRVRSGLRPWLWLAVLAAGVAGLSLYFLLPDPLWQELWYDSWTTVVAVLVVVGVLLHRPARPAPWLALAAGLGLMTLGDWTWTALSLRGEEPFPSLADAFYLSGMALVGVAVWIDGRGRHAGGDRAAGIDALILACGFALLTWFLVMKPITTAGGGTTLQTIVSLAYPTIDIALLAVTARLVLSSGLRAPSYRLLVVALGSFLVADIAFAWLDANGAYHTGHPVDAGWLVGTLCFALAALHPSMARTSGIAPSGVTRLTLRRVTILAAASLMAPMLLLVQAWQGTPIDALVIAAASIALFLLVIGRLVTVLVDLRRAFHERDVLELELRRQALEDDLTGLANRTQFTQRLAGAVGPGAGTIGLILLDLDDFKVVNDTLGHAAGDAALREVATRIRPLIRPTDTAARLGGDEFAVLLRSDLTPTSARAVAERLQRALDRPMDLDGASVPLSASVGLTIGAGADASAETLLRQADAAMYRAKASGKRSVAVFEEAEPAAEGPVERHARPVPRADRGYGAASAAGG